jgi:hypothetical protein
MQEKGLAARRAVAEIFAPEQRAQLPAYGPGSGGGRGRGMGLTMDRRGNLHLVAASVTNRRTGAVLRLRDDEGRPLWTGGRPSWKR